MSISVAVLGDRPLLVEGIAALLKRRGGFALVASGASIERLLSIAGMHRPDCMIVHLRMPDDVLAAVATAVRALPEMKLVVFVASNDPHEALRALEAGACACILKGASGQELFEALVKARRGEIYLTPSLAITVIEALKRAAGDEHPAPQPRPGPRDDQMVGSLRHAEQDRDIASAVLPGETTITRPTRNRMGRVGARNASRR